MVQIYVQYVEIEHTIPAKNFIKVVIVWENGE